MIFPKRQLPCRRGVSVYEIAGQIKDESSWVYTPIDLDPQAVVSVDLFGRRGTETATEVSQLLTAESPLSDAEFLRYSDFCLIAITHWVGK